MQRKIRLKCPACQTAIETMVGDESRVPMECPACLKQFTARVPAAVPSAPAVASSPIKPIIKAKPVAAPRTIVPARAVTASSPHAPSTHASRPNQAPSAPVPDVFAADPFHSPLGSVPDTATYNAPLSRVYPVARRRVNLKPLFIAAGSVLGLCVFAAVVWYVWPMVADVDWSAVSVAADSHEALIDDLLADTESKARLGLSMLGQQPPDAKTMRIRTVEAGRASEALLVRAVRLGKGSLEQKASFEARSKAIFDKFQPEMQAKMNELVASGKLPEWKPEQFEELRNQTDWQEAQLMTVAAAEYMKHGLFDLPAPATEPEKIYYDEADLVHEYLKALAAVRSQRQSVAASAKIDSLAQDVIELAVRRSKLPQSFLERVPVEYAEKDRAFEKAQKALIARIKRDAQVDEVFKDAVANFVFARQQLLDASNGTSESSLRDRFADTKKARSTTTEHGLNDLFADKPGPSSQPANDLALKSTRPPTSQPTDNPFAASAPTGGATNTTPSPNDMPATSPMPSAASEPTVASPFVDLPTNVDSTTSPFEGSSPFSNAGSPPIRSEVGDRLRQRAEQMRNRALGAGSGMAGGPPPDGNASPFGPTGGASGALPGIPSMPTSESVRIVIDQYSGDVNAIVKRLSNQLSSREFSSQSINNKVTLTLRFSGAIQQVVSLVDFGQVLSVDEAQRTIHVRINP